MQQTEAPTAAHMAQGVNVSLMHFWLSCITARMLCALTLQHEKCRCSPLHCMPALVLGPG